MTRETRYALTNVLIGLLVGVVFGAVGYHVSLTRGGLAGAGVLR